MSVRENVFREFGRSGKCPFGKLASGKRPGTYIVSAIALLVTLKNFKRYNISKLFSKNAEETNKSKSKVARVARAGHGPSSGLLSFVLAFRNHKKRKQKIN